MPNYKAMYHHLFNTLTDTIQSLQRAQQWAEQQYLEAEEPPLQVHRRLPESERTSK